MGLDAVVHAGALLPLLAALLSPPHAQVVATGAVSARLGGAAASRAVLRTVAGGAVAMAVTYGIGTLVGTAVSTSGAVPSAGARALRRGDAHG